MGQPAFQFAQTPSRPVFAGARISISLRAYDPDSAELSASPRLPRAMRAIERAGYKVKYRVNDLAGLVTPSLFIDGNALVSRKSVSDVAQEMIDLLRRGGLVVSGGKGVLYAPGKKRGRRAGLLVSGLPDSDNTFGDVQLDSSSVRQVQTALNRFASKLAPLVVDGIQGSKTTARLKEFQRDVGLPVTGVADSLTLQALGILAVGGASGSPGGTSVNDAIARTNAATAAALALAASRAGSSSGQNLGAQQAVIRGALVDVTLHVGYGLRTDAMMQNLKGRIAAGGFSLMGFEDNLGLASALDRTIRLRVRVETNGYGKAQDVADLIQGMAVAAGFRVTGQEGAPAQGNFGGTPPGGDSGIGTVLVIVGVVAVGGIVLSKLANR